MSKPLSLSDKFIIKAVERGYYADEQGVMYTPCGDKVPLSVAKSGHLKTTLYIPGLNERGWMAILVHRFVCYFFKGEESLREPLIRHLNSTPNDNRICNLAPGTAKQNRADIDPKVLSSNAKRNAHLLVERSRKLSDKDIVRMRKERENGTSYHKLSKMFSVSPMTAYRAVNKQSWGNIE